MNQEVTTIPGIRYVPLAVIDCIDIRVLIDSYCQLKTFYYQLFMETNYFFFLLSLLYLFISIIISCNHV